MLRLLVRLSTLSLGLTFVVCTTTASQQSQLASLNDRMSQVISALYSSPLLSKSSESSTSSEEYQTSPAQDPDPSYTYNVPPTSPPQVVFVSSSPSYLEAGAEPTDYAYPTPSNPVIRSAWHYPYEYPYAQYSYPQYAAPPTPLPAPKTYSPPIAPRPAFPAPPAPVLPFPPLPYPSQMPYSPMPYPPFTSLAPYSPAYPVPPSFPPTPFPIAPPLPSPFPAYSPAQLQPQPPVPYAPGFPQPVYSQQPYPAPVYSSLYPRLVELLQKPL